MVAAVCVKCDDAADEEIQSGSREFDQGAHKRADAKSSVRWNNDLPPFQPYKVEVAAVHCPKIRLVKRPNRRIVITLPLNAYLPVT